ncbi:carbohydrate ABC transporter permease [Luteococcus sp. OSA5]|uniref:carbohydrate ABC transporter permease n=1 Tax=Luteococcus sp. OSA5 TaxID=3401630 RepID=UPI003B4384AE
MSEQNFAVGKKPSKAGTWIALAILVALALFYIFPFVLQVVSSFKTDQDATNNPMSLTPSVWTTAAYERLFQNSDYPRWFANSVVVTLLVTAGRVFFNSLAGYALARLRFPGRKLVFIMLIGVMSVPGVVLLIPKFLVVNYLGIYDSFPALVLPLLVDAAGVFIMKNFFESIPPSVEEAARIDGAGTFRTFWSVVLPMAVPALVTITILSFQGSWNEYSHFIIASQDPNLYTLTKGVGTLASGGLGGKANQYPLKLAAAAIMTVPVAILFFVFQKRIMNTSAGAVKE